MVPPVTEPSPAPKKPNFKREVDMVRQASRHVLSAAQPPRRSAAWRRPRTAAVWAAVIVAAATLGAQGPVSVEQALALNERGDEMFADARYAEAFQAYDAALSTPDAETALYARKGKVRAALRLSFFQEAQREGELLRALGGDDAEAQTLYGDSLWGSALFDEAEVFFERAFERYPTSARARFGVARSLATRGQFADALDEAREALSLEPEDVEILVLVGEMHERLHQFDEAAEVYESYVDLLPSRLRNDADIAALKIRLLRAFSGRAPVALEDDEATPSVHTVPFTLVDKKVVVRGTMNGHDVQFVLDTGSDRVAVSRDTALDAGLQGITQTMITGVGRPGIRRLSVGRADSIVIGSLSIRDVPVSIREEDLPGVPHWRNDVFNPMALGLSVAIDYDRGEVTFGTQLPDSEADFRLPMRFYRLPMVRGVLNAEHSAYFLVDTGGELMSISRDVEDRLTMTPVRRIPIKVWGVTGLDPDAFLLPGVDLDFDDIAYRQAPVAVLNLRPASVLLGFEVGGILGHKFLGGYRVAMDLARAELRLQEY